MDWQQVQAWALAIWNGLPLLQMIGFAVAGTLLGSIGGLTLAVVMHKRGWLRRHNHWHHAGLKSYFLVLPLVSGLIGLQLGLSAAAHVGLNAQVDHFRPEAKTLASGWMQDFQQSLEQSDFAAFRQGDTTVQQTVTRLVSGYLHAYPLMDDPWWQQTWMRRLGHAQLNRMRKDLIGTLVSEQLIASAADRSGLDEAVFEHALNTRLRDLLDSDRLLDLVKVQINQLMWSVHIGVLLQWIALLAVVALEYGVYRWYIKSKAIKRAGDH